MAKNLKGPKRIMRLLCKGCCSHTLDPNVEMLRCCVVVTVLFDLSGTFRSVNWLPYVAPGIDTDTDTNTDTDTDTGLLPFRCWTVFPVDVWLSWNRLRIILTQDLRHHTQPSSECFTNFCSSEQQGMHGWCLLTILPKCKTF